MVVARDLGARCPGTDDGGTGLLPGLSDGGGGLPVDPRQSRPGSPDGNPRSYGPSGGVPAGPEAGGRDMPSSVSGGLRGPRGDLSLSQPVEL